jgi:enamine deaminase RidA (YjgF/YER057c/UK114 family)
MSFENRVKEAGYEIEPLLEMDSGRYVHAVRTGNLVFTSGQVSTWNGKDIKGKIGTDLTIEQGYEGAKFCALNNLRAIKTLIGSLDKITKIIRVNGMVNVAEGFDKTPEVIHGCSDLLREIFGEVGYHTRCAVGMTLPHNWAVEITMIVEVRE